MDEEWVEGPPPLGYILKKSHLTYLSIYYVSVGSGAITLHIGIAQNSLVVLIIIRFILSELHGGISRKSHLQDVS